MLLLCLDLRRRYLQDKEGRHLAYLVRYLQMCLWGMQHTDLGFDYMFHLDMVQAQKTEGNSGLPDMPNIALRVLIHFAQ